MSVDPAREEHEKEATSGGGSGFIGGSLTSVRVGSKRGVVVNLS